jgi:hypothetical protein
MVRYRNQAAWSELVHVVGSTWNGLDALLAVIVTGSQYLDALRAPDFGSGDVKVGPSNIGKRK